MKLDFMSQAGSVNIDGKSFSGRSIVIENGKVTVDGVTQDGSLTGDINVTVDGDVEKLELAYGKVECKNVGSVATQSGDVECHDVSGSVSTMSGDVDCGRVGGSVSTMSGDISHL